jgi:succinoglycan biosynthesis protein ExoO
MLAVANDADVVSDDLHIISSSFIDPGKPKSLSLLLRQGLSITAPRRLGLTEFTRHDLGLLMPLIRRSFLQQHDLKFNPNLDHVVDFHLYFEMLALNARWLQMTDAYYFHYRHTGNMSSNTVGLAEDIHKSSEVLLNHPVVAADAALGATLQHRMREWHSHAAFATVYSLLRQRRGSELARLLSEKPSYLWLTISKIVRSLYRRMLRVFAAGLDSRKVYT